MLASQEALHCDFCIHLGTKYFSFNLLNKLIFSHGVDKINNCDMHASIEHDGVAE